MVEQARINERCIVIELVRTDIRITLTRCKYIRVLILDVVNERMPTVLSLLFIFRRSTDRGFTVSGLIFLTEHWEQIFSLLGRFHGAFLPSP